MAAQISNSRRRFAWEWAAVLSCMALIFGGSSVPGKDIPSLFHYQDILYHLAIYAILTLLFSRALRKSVTSIDSRVLLISAVAFGVIYGASDELHQLFVPGRSCSGMDLLVDGIGSFLGGIAQRCLK